MGLNKLKIILEMIKFEHTIFALPFAFMGAVLGNMVVEGTWPTWSEIGWIIAAMVGARSAAMALNRLIDRRIDAKNPRTSKRAIPAGLISEKEVILFIIGSFALLFLAASQLNRLAVILLPVAVFILVFYSYTKRFTWLCHVILGASIGLAPLGGWVAVTGQIDGLALILYVSVIFWTAGFDIIYACQDVEFDRREGLYSIPSRFGLARALFLARLFHGITIAGLVALAVLVPLGTWFMLGVAVAAGLLIYEHRLVSPGDLSRLNTAFFTMNGTLSVVIFVSTILEYALQ